MSTLSFYEFHNIYGFWGKKNFKRNVFFDQNNQLIEISHNSFGARDHEFDIKNKKKKCLCFGGSHTWGAANEIEERFSNILSNEITDIDFYNLGQCSFGLDQIFFFIKNEIKKFNPFQIIIEQYPWALLRIINSYVNGYIRPHFLIDQNGRIVEKNIPIYAKLPFLRYFQGSYYQFKKEFNEYSNNINISNTIQDIDPLFKLWNQFFYNEMYKICKHIFLLIKEICEKLNIKLLVLVNISKEELLEKDVEIDLVDYGLPRKNLIKILTDLNIEYIDLFYNFKNSSQIPFYDDGHINPYGNKKIAQEIIKLYGNL